MARYNIGVTLQARQALSTSKDLNRRFQVLGGTVQRLRGLLGGLFAFSLISVGLFGTIRTLRDFSQELSTVQAITGASAAEFERLRLEAQRLGATTRFTASQAAEGMVFLARAGFDVSNVLEATEGSLRLAQAGALALGRAADIASNILIGFGLEVGQIGRVVDILALASNRSNTNVEQLGQAMKFVAPIAAGVRLEVEETSAALGVLADAGLQASIGGTGLRRVLAELEAPTRRSGNILNNLGVEADEVRISQVGLTAAIQRLGEAGVNTGLALQIFGDRGGPAFEVLANGVPRLRQLTEALQGAEGSAEEMARIMDDNLNGAMLAVASASEAIVIEFGRASGLTDGLTDSARGLATFIRSLVADIDNVVNAVQALGVVLAVYLAGKAIPAAIIALNAMTKAILATSTASLLAGYKAFPALIVAVRAFTVALIANPIGIFIAAIGAAIALLIGFSDRIDVTADGVITLRDAMASAFSGIAEAGGELIAIIGSLAQAFGPLVAVVVQIVAILINTSGVLQILEVITQALAIAARILSVALGLIAPVIEIIIVPIQYLLELIARLIGAFDGLSDRSRRFAEERRAEQEAQQVLLNTPVIPEAPSTPLVRPDSGISIEDVRGTPSSTFEEEIQLLENESAALRVNARERQALERIQQIELNTLQELIGSERELVDTELALIQSLQDRNTIQSRANELQEEIDVIRTLTSEQQLLQETQKLSAELNRELTSSERDRIGSLINTVRQLELQQQAEAQLLDLRRDTASLRISDGGDRQRAQFAQQLQDDFGDLGSSLETVFAAASGAVTGFFDSVESGFLDVIDLGIPEFFGLVVDGYRELLGLQSSQEQLLAAFDENQAQQGTNTLTARLNTIHEETAALRVQKAAREEVTLLIELEASASDSLTDARTRSFLIALKENQLQRDTNAFEAQIKALREQHSLIGLTNGDREVAVALQQAERDSILDLTTARRNDIAAEVRKGQIARDGVTVSDTVGAIEAETEALRHGGIERDIYIAQQRLRSETVTDVAGATVALTAALREKRGVEDANTLRAVNVEHERRLEVLTSELGQRRLISAQIALERRLGRTPDEGLTFDEALTARVQERQIIDAERADIRKAEISDHENTIRLLDEQDVFQRDILQNVIAYVKQLGLSNDAISSSNIVLEVLKRRALELRSEARNIGQEENRNYAEAIALVDTRTGLEERLLRTQQAATREAERLFNATDAQRRAAFVGEAVARERNLATLEGINLAEKLGQSYQDQTDIITVQLGMTREQGELAAAIASASQSIRQRLSATLSGIELETNIALVEADLRDLIEATNNLTFKNIVEGLEDQLDLAALVGDNYKELAFSIDEGVATGRTMSEVLKGVNVELNIQTQLLQLETQVTGGFNDKQRESVEQLLRAKQAARQYTAALSGLISIQKEIDTLELFDPRAAAQLSLLQRFGLDGPLEGITLTTDQVKDLQDTLAELGIENINLEVVTPEQLQRIKGAVLALDTYRFGLQQQNELLNTIQGPQEDLINRFAALESLADAGRISLSEYNQELRNLQLEQLNLTVERGEGGVLDGFVLGFEDVLSETRNFRVQFGEIMADTFRTFTDGFANSIGQAVLGMKSFGEAMRDVGRQIVVQLIGALIKLGVQLVITRILGATLGATAVAQSVAEAAIVATAWAPAAAAAALATLGANATPAAAALVGTHALSLALSTAGGAAGGGAAGAAVTARDGGYISGPGGPRSDMIPARLSDGEFVVNAAATRNNRAELEAINSGRGGRRGDTIYNNTYNITTPDADSFKRNQQQILSKQARSQNRAAFRE